MTTFSASLTNLTAPLPQSRDNSYYVSRPILASPPLCLQNTLIYAHTTSRTLTACDISIDPLTLPPSELGDLLELILLYLARVVCIIAPKYTYKVRYE